MNLYNEAVKSGVLQMKETYVAIDIGASSGRIIALHFINGRHVREEIHRFSDYLIKDGEYWHWDINYIYDEIIIGLKEIVSRELKIRSIGIDTFGVDVVLLDSNNKLMSMPYSYRNNLGDYNNVEINKVISRKNLYLLTGIQYMPFNTLYQLEYLKQELKYDFKKILMLPDYLSFLLTNVMRMEITNFSTTNLMNMNSKKIIEEIKLIDIDSEVFSPFIYPGDKYGSLKEELKEELNIDYDIDVIAVCSHDTASAITGIPIKKSQLYISSGTWGILGTLTTKPIMSNKARTYNFSNELGYGNKIRLLKNTTGLWIQNQCIKLYKNDNPSITMDEIYEEVLHVEPFKSYIDVDDSRFNSPKNMILEIQKYCKETNQIIPQSIGEIIMCVYQSMAFKYDLNIKELEDITKKSFKEIYIVGGGSQIEILNQMIASATNKRVVTGEVEATVLGNLLIQLKASKPNFNIEKGIKMLQTNEEIIYEPNQVCDYEYEKIKYNKIVRIKNERTNNQ